MNMRGLKMFISNVRQASSVEQERRVVDKEMAHIRTKFGGKKLDGYGKKKYVWKLLYMYMLGHDIEIGHMEALQLVTSLKFSEKQAGYMACSILFNERHELLRLIIQSVKKDLQPKDEKFQCLALSCAANVGGQEFAESLADDVQKILVSSKTHSFVRKKAALCLLRLYRKFPDAMPQGDNEFTYKVLSLLDYQDYGLVTSVMSLILCLVSVSIEGYSTVPAKVIHVLNKLVFEKKKTQYRYYLIPCPWLQVKLLRVLQYFPPPAETEGSKDKQTTLNRLRTVLEEILSVNFEQKNVNKKNAEHAILFEAINLIAHLGRNNELHCHVQAVRLLGKFVGEASPNFRYLALDAMVRLISVPGTLTSFKVHLKTIQQSLKDQDISIRKRALDMMYVMCDKSNARAVVTNLLKFLQSSSYDMREEMVLKIAILAEKFATDLRWYVDVNFQLITKAGDFVSEDIWYRVIQIVTNNDELQDYAATTCYKFLSAPSVHETGLQVGAYILGEFGHQIKNRDITGVKIFDVLRSKFAIASPATRALMLSCYIKMSNTYPELKPSVDQIFNKHRSYVDTEIQQRACEYAVVNKQSDELMNKLFEVMPNFPERESLLLKKLKKISKAATTDRDAFHAQDEKKDEDDSSDSSKSDSSGSSSGSSSSSSSSESEEEDDNPFPAMEAGKTIELLSKSKGVVYNCKHLQIGFQMKCEIGKITITLFYGNRSAHTLKKLTASCPESRSYVLSMDPPPPFTVQAKQQARQEFVWESQRPFDFPPEVTLAFKWNDSSQKILMKMPFLVTHFFLPDQMTSTDFLPKWQQTGNESQISLKVESLDFEDLKAKLKGQMNLGVVEMDPPNICACGTFNTSKKLRMQCFIRLEVKVKVKAFRLTVRSPHQSLSDAVKNSIKTFLNAKEF